ncbi:hypothetical protein ADUPG1_002556, partial [Aduncisulcus paluster]
MSQVDHFTPVGAEKGLSVQAFFQFIQGLVAVAGKNAFLCVNHDLAFLDPAEDYVG